jgi:hypothetical protein
MFDSDNQLPVVLILLQIILREKRTTTFEKACLGTPQHADHARTDPRNEATVKLCQPTLPESRVRGVVGGRVFADVFYELFIKSTAHCKQDSISR